MSTDNATTTNGNGAHAPVAESLDDILGIEDRPIHELYVPEWGMTVYVRVLGGQEYEGLQASLVTRDEEGNATTHHEKYRIGVVSAGLVNAKGERLVVGEAAREKLNQKNSAALQRISNKIAEVSVTTAKAYEDLKGNSESDTSTVSLVA